MRKLLYLFHDQVKLGCWETVTHEPDVESRIDFIYELWKSVEYLIDESWLVFIEKGDTSRYEFEQRFLEVHSRIYVHTELIVRIVVEEADMVSKERSRIGKIRDLDDDLPRDFEYPVDLFYGFVIVQMFEDIIAIELVCRIALKWPWIIIEVKHLINSVSCDTINIHISFKYLPSASKIYFHIFWYSWEVKRAILSQV